MTRFRVDDDFFAYHITTKILHKIPLAEDRPLQYIFETLLAFFSDPNSQLCPQKYSIWISA